ncbi:MULTISPECIES: LacI family DNA-binding transcriptional regulator [unclassified Duganella]|uniref:LacI family DNA-binding transcriptional regulator n=1 Tax=unclassified Duganella TaxID=2636909 RepID=UPI0008834BC8|nr:MULTISPECIES: LacI family DNA-binding transcriptional regulator [unclassified Duganella]SDF42554.1 transcriptional regulator, LacI family [Duganella sp. OV458]SDI83982.1 transcriptional regulator, LacI family [Duganella sp. OV510]
MATIKDVARLAGVGLGTASRVISGKGSVSKTTQEKVLKAIEELEFRPSHAARSLLSGTTQMVGVYIPYLSGTFYTPILQAIYTALREAGLNMVVAFGVGDGDARNQAIDGLNFLIERGSDGLIVMSSEMMDEDIVALGPFQSRVVVINQAFPSIAKQCFTVDHEAGGRLAARTLLDAGHRKIAVIAGRAAATDNQQRIAGFKAELEEAGVDTRKMWLADGDFTPEGGWTCAEKLLQSGEEFTALFCANDEMAVGALSMFQKAGVQVPQQVSVLGYDDTHSAEFTAPQLTSVHIPWSEMTMSGLNYLLNHCYGLKRPVAREYRLHVAERASLASVARKKK